MKIDPLKISGMHDGAKPVTFKNAEELRQNMTKPELMLWEFLKSKPLRYKFRRQHPIGNYVLDFYCHKLRISIEVDGAYHLTQDQKTSDAERTAYLKSVGITEYRFTNEEILQHYDKSVETVKTILRANSL